MKTLQFSLLKIISTFIICGIFLVIFLFLKNIQNLPNHEELKNYEPPIITRFYSSEGILLEEYAKEKRIFIPIKAIPDIIKNAFISAEDNNFYTHNGLDFQGITRALLKNISNILQNKKHLVGGSTITQQVVKNFFLSNKKTIDRKIKEAIIAFRITKAFSKEKILELYLNQIYLGSNSYGVAAASLNYFNKSVEELTIEEAALLAALPKAPSYYTPRVHYEHALIRRNWVIERMQEENFITKKEAIAAKSKPINLKNYQDQSTIKADFFAENVRKNIAEMYGEKALYEDGLYVRTTLDVNLQKIADKALKNGLINYDRKDGYHGPITNLSKSANIVKDFNNYKNEILPSAWEYAIVEKVQSNIVNIRTHSISGIITKESAEFALKKHSDFTKILKKNDLIIVNHEHAKIFSLQQIPKINGGIVVLDPKFSKVLAIVGGFNYKDNQYDRVTQANRQPGSCYKTFVYLTAMENNIQPNLVLIDEPISVSQGHGMPLWQPRNYTRNFLGPMTIRKGVELSRNTIVVKLAQELGINKIIDTTKRFNINQNPPRFYSITLGAIETTLLNITNAYAMIANGGLKNTPSLIEKIQDRNGNIIYKNDKRECLNCYSTEAQQNLDINSPNIIDNRTRVTDENSAFQTLSMLEGSIQHTKTSAILRTLNIPIAGKSGTTNDSKDTWFIGFTSDLVIGVYVGYDNPKSLGKRVTGSTLSLPIFYEFLKNAKKFYQFKEFTVPAGIELVKIDYNTGYPSNEIKDTIYEAFKK